MQRIMFDLETLGTSKASIICSIGAVLFGDISPIQQENYKEFYRELDITSQRRYCDPATVLWWMDQKGPKPFYGRMSLDRMLHEFSDWLIGIRSRDPEKKIELWCKGTDFDTSILGDAYKSKNLEVPWKYSETRDYRTVSKLFPNLKPSSVNQDLHNALADAKHQALHMEDILYAIKDRGLK